MNEMDVELLIELCSEKICDFHLYSLGLKYYSYLERNRDFEDPESGCDHKDCDHDEKITCASLMDLKKVFEDYVGDFAANGSLPRVNRLMDMRGELKNHVSVLTAYGDQITLLENVYFKSRYTDEKMVAMDTDEEFARKVVEQLMAGDNASEIREHLKIIYPELPMRMTKSKFYSLSTDILRNSEAFQQSM